MYLFKLLFALRCYFFICNYKMINFEEFKKLFNIQNFSKHTIKIDDIILVQISGNKITVDSRLGPMIMKNTLRGVSINKIIDVYLFCLEHNIKHDGFKDHPVIKGRLLEPLLYPVLLKDKYKSNLLSMLPIEVIKELHKF
jgi:hypothetical protein